MHIRMFLIFFAFTIYYLSSCQTMNTETPDSQSTASEPDLTTQKVPPIKTPPTSKNTLPVTTPESRDTSISSENSTVQENIDRVLEIIREYRSYTRQETSGEDPESKLQEKFSRVKQACKQLAARYSGKALKAEEHFALCRHLSDFREGFQDEAAAHCQAYLAMGHSDSNSKEFSLALFIKAQCHFRAGDEIQSEKNFQQYLERFCNSDNPLPASLDEQLAAASCKRILTFYLPEIYHNTGNIDALGMLPDQCKARRFNEPQSLKKIHDYLLEDLWKRGDLTALSQFSDKIANLETRKGFKVSRHLIPHALSNQSRLKLIEGDFFGIRNVFMNFEWDHPGIEKTWHTRHLKGPINLLCTSAPELQIRSWVLDKSPTALPGGTSADARPILLYFFEPNISTLTKKINGIISLANRQKDALQIIGLISFTGVMYDIISKQILVDLQADTFRKNLGNLVKDLKIPFPIGILDGGKEDSNLVNYFVNFYPSLILIDSKNRVVSYHTNDIVDLGWDRSLSAMVKG